MKHYPLKVPGAQAAGSIDVVSPYDGQLVGSVACLDAAGVDLALKTVTELFNDKKNWLPVHKRLAILERAVQILLKRSASLITTAITEGGKPYADTQAELFRAVDSLKSCIACLRTDHGTEVPMQLTPASGHRLAFTHKEPIGPVVAVSAFNHPINLIIHQIGPALAAGCPTVIKPARDTPLSAFALVAILHEAGLPEAWCLPVLTKEKAVTEQLVTDPRVAFFSFIGSAEVGWRLRSKLAPGTRCALEHGGMAPVIMTEDADWERMLPLLAKGGFYHAGQVCVSVQRVFVHRSIARKVAEGLASLAEKMKVGNPAERDTEIGPLIRPQEADRIEAWVNEAVAEGAELITGGQRLSASLFQPTVLFNPSAQSKVSQKEIFGPVICLYEYNHLDEAITQANRLPYAFQAAVMTRHIDTALHCYKHLAASAVLINDHTAFRTDWMPFAGLRQSGLGTGGIPYTFEAMQIEKMAIFNSAAW